ncbi:hypothetical protein GCM10009000_053260 [Halobacterium noricense]
MVLTTAVQLRGYDEEGLSFTHSKHPLTQWAARALENWEYLREYTACAHEEWRYRWNHGLDEYHGSWAGVRRLNDDRIAALDWTGNPGDPPQVVGDWRTDDYVDAYRLYYANEKRHLFEWAKNRRPPPWLDEYRRE